MHVSGPGSAQSSRRWSLLYRVIWCHGSANEETGSRIFIASTACKLGAESNRLRLLYLLISSASVESRQSFVSVSRARRTVGTVENIAAESERCSSRTLLATERSSGTSGGGSLSKLDWFDISVMERDNGHSLERLNWWVRQRTYARLSSLKLSSVMVMLMYDHSSGNDTDTNRHCLQTCSMDHMGLSASSISHHSLSLADGVRLMGNTIVSRKMSESTLGGSRRTGLSRRFCSRIACETRSRSRSRAEILSSTVDTWASRSWR